MAGANVEVNILVNGKEQLDDVKYSMQGFNQEVDNSKKKIDTLIPSSDKLGKKLGQIETRALAAKFGLTAMIGAVARGVVEAEKYARANDEVNKVMSAQLLLVKQNESAWNRFKIAVGSTVIEIKAMVAEGKILEEARRDSIKELGIQTQSYLSLTVEQRKLVDGLAEEKKAQYLLQIQNAASMETYKMMIPTFENINQSIKDRIALNRAQIEGNTEMVSLEIRHREELAQLEIKLKDGSIAQTEYNKAKAETIALQKEEKDSIKALTEAKNKEKTSTEDLEAAEAKLNTQRKISAGDLTFNSRSGNVAGTGLKIFDKGVIVTEGKKSDKKTASTSSSTGGQ